MRQKETLLVEAGFKAIPAVTSQQQWLLGTLPTDRLSPVVRMGKVYFVYPDHEHRVVYVGHNAEYLAYEQKAQAKAIESKDWESAWSDWDAH
jgi:hypothetical protein